MRGPGRATLLANGGSLLVLGWLYGGELRDAARARAAEVAALAELPRPGFAAGVLALAAAAAAVLLAGVWTGRGRDYKGYRLLPILLVVTLFVDLLALSPERPPDSWTQAALALERLRQLALELSTPEGRVPGADALAARLGELGRPPYLVHGQPVEGYTLQARAGCTGPVAEAPGARVGTFLYCVAPDGRSAWLTVVGLPSGVRFGAPGILSHGGGIQVARVSPSPEAAPGGEAGPGDRKGGMQRVGEPPDGG